MKYILVIDFTCQVGHEIHLSGKSLMSALQTHWIYLAWTLLFQLEGFNLKLSAAQDATRKAEQKTVESEVSVNIGILILGKSQILIW